MIGQRLTNSGAARFELSAELEAISGGVRTKLFGGARNHLWRGYRIPFLRSCVWLQGEADFLWRSYELASWRGFGWLQGEVWMILASQARLSLWAHVILSDNILDLHGLFRDNLGLLSASVKLY